jgi:sporulation protein YlmC with PRC-barrel domain
VIVVGLMGERIGTVERLEIDRTGRLKSLVIRVASSLETRKRITAEQIRSVQDGIVRIALSGREVRNLADIDDPASDLPIEAAASAET